jgi:cytoskeletal protein CcmA (bactofilin family)
MFAKRDRSGDGPLGEAPRPEASAERWRLKIPGDIPGEPEEPAAAPLPPGTEMVPSIVAAGMSVRGDVVTDGDVHIDGTVVGTVTCATATIGRGGRLTGHLRSLTVRIQGHVDGEIVADKVEVTSTGRVVGHVFLRTLEVHVGASYFCETRPMEEAPAGTDPAPAEPRPAAAGPRPEDRPEPTIVQAPAARAPAAED